MFNFRDIFIINDDNILVVPLTHIPLNFITKACELL
jgi:hypothetical protein